MNLNLALQKMADRLGVSGDEMIAYANEEDIGGFDLGKGTWPMGSIWAVEGRYLYAIVRAMRPTRVLELGANHGCSACHILSALEANGKGKLTSVDLYPWSQENPMITDVLKQRWTFEGKDFVEFLDNAPRSPRSKFDIVFEDGAHGREGTEQVLRKVAERNPTMVISHDAEHFTVGKDISAAFSAVYPDMQTVLIDNTDCGFAWWLSPTYTPVKREPVKADE